MTNQIRALSGVTGIFLAFVVCGEGYAEQAGKSIYEQTCIACHGADGTGALPGMPDFSGTDSPLNKVDIALVKSITEGFQSPGSQMAMPPKGGNPTLSSADVDAVLVYIRSSFGKR